jgi:hypothetical protein
VLGVLLISGCSNASAQPASLFYSSAEDGAVIGSGYNAEAAAEGVAFKDMSNLYGIVSSTTYRGTGFNPAATDGQAPAGNEDIVRAHKLVKNGKLRIKTEGLETSEKPLSDIMEKYGAWSASTRIFENSRNYALRVPSVYYEAFLGELAGLGRIIHRSESAEDVSLRYYDLESRLETKEALLKTFQNYLAKSKTIEEILNVEQRIAELQQEIDWTGKELKNLAHLVDYSTVELEILGPASVSSYSAPTLGERFGKLFGSLGEILGSALVVLTGIVMYGVPALLAVVFLFWILFGRIGLIKRLWYLAGGKTLALKKRARRPGRFCR